MHMKPINKLNEDFFDDFDSNDPDDEPVDDLIDDPDYTYDYNIHFIIYMYPFIKEYKGFVSKNTGEYKEDAVYSFEENPKYKPIIESGFLSMKKALDYILQASSIVTDYSKAKFCSSNEKIIKTYPFMDNKSSNEFIIKFSDNHFITLKTSINLSGRKNVFNLTKLFYSFWRLQQIYDKLLSTTMFNINMSSAPYINIGVYKNNPYKKANLYALMPSDRELTSGGLELINLLNSKDETDK